MESNRYRFLAFIFFSGYFFLYCVPLARLAIPHTSAYVGAVFDQKHFFSQPEEMEREALGMEVTSEDGGYEIIELESSHQHLSVPVVGVRVRDIADTWGASRDGGRRQHEGVDIFAPKGTKVVTPVDAVVYRVGVGRLGGNFVTTFTHEGEWHYYAHLDEVSSQLQPGVPVQKGTVLGTVGNTGNARRTPPHLHFGIYTKHGAVNPYDRFR